MALRLKSRSNACIGGFLVNVPQTGFNQRFWSFSEAANSLWKHLQANPGLLERSPSLPQNFEACEEYVDLMNAHRMRSIKGGNAYIIDAEDPSPPKSMPSRQTGSFAGAVEGARKTAAGAFTLLSWLGEGAKPVSEELANARAANCAECPLNNKDIQLTTLYTVRLANMLRRQLEARRDLQLATAYDDRIGVCMGCACPLKLKVHVGIRHIGDHMPEFVRKDLAPGCWVLRELHFTD